jgi:prepilin-type N-terminal cleavage/methylation domain-containing protein
VCGIGKHVAFEYHTNSRPEVIGDGLEESGQGGQSMRTRRGFTLIELLVVIAIIAILAAILFPVFISAKEKAATMKCLAHGREVGQATMMYMSDNGDRFPSSISIWSQEAQDAANAYMSKFTWRYAWGGVDKTWSAAQMGSMQYIHLKKYVKNQDIWICPSPKGLYCQRYAYGFRMSWLPRSSDNFVDGDRGFVLDDPKDPNNPLNGIGLTVAQVQSNDAEGVTACGRRYMPPSKKVMWMCYALGAWGNYNFPKTPDPWGRIKWPDYAHADGSTFVYADGHAAWQKMGSGWAPLGYTKLDIDQHQ